MADSLSRRDFAALLGAAGFAISAPAGARPVGPTAVSVDKRAATAVGEAYLARFPEEKKSLRLHLALAGVGPQNVNDVVRRDFAAGRIVQVDGWMLSRTEARLCALVALDPAG